VAPLSSLQPQAVHLTFPFFLAPFPPLVPRFVVAVISFGMQAAKATYDKAVAALQAGQFDTCGTLLTQLKVGHVVKAKKKKKEKKRKRKKQTCEPLLPPFFNKPVFCFSPVFPDCSHANDIPALARHHVCSGDRKKKRKK
jgi:hypothetical protein